MQIRFIFCPLLLSLQDYKSLYGILDPRYEPPKGLNPAKNADIVATSAGSYLTGASGVMVYKIGSTHYYLVVAWEEREISGARARVARPWVQRSYSKENLDILFYCGQ